MIETQLQQTPAGPALAAALAQVDPSRVDADSAMVVAAAARRLQAHYAAVEYRAVAAGAADSSGYDALDRRHVAFGRVGAPGTPEVSEFVPDEWAAAWGCASATAATRVGDALDLAHRLPATLAALEAGELDAFRAQTIARTTRHVSSETARLVEADVLGRAGRISIGRLRNRVEAAVIRHDREAAEALRATEQRDLDVQVGPSQDGVSDVYAWLESDGAGRLRDRVQEVAEWLALDGDDRSAGQRRAAALAMLADPASVHALYQRTHPEASGPEVGSLPATVLYVHHIRRADGSVAWELEGAGPITAQEASELIGHSTVNVRPVIDLADMAESSGYQPGHQLREAVRLTNGTCVFPYCPRTARRCDLDHTIEWPRGPTTAENLGPLCRHHHRLKTAGVWQLSQPANGTFVWCSPTGRTYTVDPSGSVVSERG